MVPRSLASGHECRIDRDFPPPMRIVAVLVWRRGGGQGDFRSDAAAASVRGGRPTGARSRPTRRPFPGSEETIPLGAGPVSSWLEARSRLVSVRGPPGAVEQHFGHDDAIEFDAFVLLISDSSSLDARPVTPAPNRAAPVQELPGPSLRKTATQNKAMSSSHIPPVSTSDKTEYAVSELDGLLD